MMLGERFYSHLLRYLNYLNTDEADCEYAEVGQLTHS